MSNVEVRMLKKDQDRLTTKLVRNAVAALLVGDMVIDVDFGFLDLDVFERALWQRAQGLFF